MKSPLLMGAGCLVALTALSSTTDVLAQQPQSARASFVDTKGQQVGKATLTQMEKGVLIDLDISGIAPGEHAFHVHEFGKCEPNTAFESAGGHYGPQGHQHGYQMVKGPHVGDMPNQFVGQDGKLRAHVINPNITLGSGQGTLFDQDGSALVIHVAPDDYKSQPTGNAGGRLICAVVEK